jgi:hypothetical protein
LRGTRRARNGRFSGQSRLRSPFVLRVVAGDTLGWSTTYARQFAVNQGHRSGIKPCQRNPLPTDWVAQRGVVAEFNS